MVEKRRVGQTEIRLEGGNMQEVDEERRLRLGNIIMQDPLSTISGTTIVVDHPSRQ